MGLSHKLISTVGFWIFELNHSKFFTEGQFVAAVGKRYGLLCQVCIDIWRRLAKTTSDVIFNYSVKGKRGRRLRSMSPQTSCSFEGVPVTERLWKETVCDLKVLKKIYWPLGGIRSSVCMIVVCNWQFDNHSGNHLSTCSHEHQQLVYTTSCATCHVLVGVKWEDGN